GARGERDGGIFAVVNEALTRERLGALDGGLIGNRCGLSGRRHGISHDLAICAERRVAACISAWRLGAPRLVRGSMHGRDFPGIVDPPREYDAGYRTRR